MATPAPVVTSGFPQRVDYGDERSFGSMPPRLPSSRTGFAGRPDGRSRVPRGRRRPAQEVARRRGGVGGATLMTAQWSPWFTFELHGRVPAVAFRPRPNVDGGVLVLRRRADPLLPVQHRTAFKGFAHRVFTGPGRGLADVLRRTGAFASTNDARRWLRTQAGRVGRGPQGPVRPAVGRPLPRDGHLTTEDETAAPLAQVIFSALPRADRPTGCGSTARVPVSSSPSG